MDRLIEAECLKCGGTGECYSEEIGTGVMCSYCVGDGLLRCPDKGGVDCPHPQQCICEAAWDQQETDKMENG